jgi:PAS domain-containing protein
VAAYAPERALAHPALDTLGAGATTSSGRGWGASMSSGGSWQDSALSTGLEDPGLTVESPLFLAADAHAAGLAGFAAVRDANEGRAPLRAIASSLDGVEVAMCAVDYNDRIVCWNDTFLRFFPEHAGLVHEGEPYQAALARFHGVRLDGEAHHLADAQREQGRATRIGAPAAAAFNHRGVLLQPAEQDWAAGRVFVWRRASDAAAGAAAEPLGVPGGAGLGGALDLFEHVGEGVMLTGPHGRIVWVNDPFVAMYRLAGKATAIQADFAEVYCAAWHGADAAERGRFEAGRMLLDDNLRFAGGPFELPLPGRRWVRVVEQRRPDGFGCFAHVDVSMMKRRERQLARAEQRVRDRAAMLAEKAALLETVLARIERREVLAEA